MEHRRSKRRSVETAIPVINTMTGQVMGQIGNLSVDGLMLIASRPVKNNALYQLSFHIEDNRGVPVAIEVGCHEQWSEVAQTGQYWAGFRIIDIAARDLDLLAAWVENED